MTIEEVVISAIVNGRITSEENDSIANPEVMQTGMSNLGFIFFSDGCRFQVFTENTPWHFFNRHERLEIQSTLEMFISTGRIKEYIKLSKL